MADERRQTTQSIAWFWDLYKRGLLNLDPPYQRRSVWPQSYKDYFIDTVLLHYPAPAVFLFEDIDEEGVAQYSVVDGKQRLATIFDFLSNLFPVSDAASMARLKGLAFADLPPEIKRKFYGYQFAIEFLPSTDEGTLSNIFDRINRNVARLTPQELRHARFSGVFTKKSEDLAEVLEALLPKDFPRIAPASKRQMKDVEFVAQLLLLTESGVETYSQEDLDAAYSARDEDWEDGPRVEQEYRDVLANLGLWAEDLLDGEARRLRNQADFYSLYGATLQLRRNGVQLEKAATINRLQGFMSLVSDESARQLDSDAKRYYEAARSASNDVAQRRDRIDILVRVMEQASRDGT
ncbi:MAG TPA: DUF262 domain-containing protein [Candidatus Limnocylindrales bacterium]|nr:DUF262 domain-containing protein [Candidatus Limnocylindrales bacterium]